MKCGRISDWELAKALRNEAKQWIERYPDCSPTLAVYDVLMKKHKIKTGALVRELNELFGRKYTTNIYGKWHRGERPFPRIVESHMQAEILTCLFGPSWGEMLTELLGEEKREA
jgi:hypothetical protein